jgi:hypothetical protein
MMAPMRVAASDFSLPTRLRRHCLLGVGVLVALIMLVGLEQRLAEAHFNLRSASPGLENIDSLEGDEIRGRLVILNDDRPPTLPGAAGGAVGMAVLGSLGPPWFALVGQPEPRGPPVLRSSAA